MLGGSRLVWALFLVGAAIAYLVLLQPPGCNQTAHYSLVESLSRGTPRIDRFHDQTCDTAYVGGHYFAAKAPGLALATLPVFEVLRLARAVPENASLHAGFPAAMLGLSRRALWQVGLFGSVLPALGALGVLFLAAPDLLRTDRAVGQSTGLLALCGLLLVLSVLALRSDLGVLAAGLPLAALAVPGFASHTKQALVAVLISLIGVAALELRRRQLVTRRTSA